MPKNPSAYKLKQVAAVSSFLTAHQHIIGHFSASTDSERPHRCCHLLNNSEILTAISEWQWHIPYTDIPYTYNGLEDARLPPKINSFP